MNTAVATPDPDDGARRLSAQSVGTSVLHVSVIRHERLSAHAISVDHLGSHAVSGMSINKPGA